MGIFHDRTNMFDIPRLHNSQHTITNDERGAKSREYKVKFDRKTLAIMRGDYVCIMKREVLAE